VPDRQGCRLQPLVAGLGSLRAFLRLEGKVEVFQALDRLGLENGLAEIIIQFALALDALEDGMLAIGQLPEEGDPRLDLPDDLLVEPAGSLLAIASDERDGVA